MNEFFYSVRASDPSTRLVMKSMLRGIGWKGREVLVKSTEERLGLSPLELHLESWRAALIEEAGSCGWIFMIDAQVQFCSGAALQLPKLTPPAEAALCLLGACYVEAPQVTSPSWLQVPGDFEHVSGYWLVHHKLPELLDVGEAAVASGVAEVATVLRRVFGNSIYGVWPPLTSLSPARKGIQRVLLFDARGVQINYPHAIAHLPRVPGRSSVESWASKPSSARPNRKRLPAICTTWREAEDFPRILKACNLMGTVVGTGTRDGSFAAMVLSIGRGRQWVGVEEWRVRAPSEWLDVRNDPRPGVWQNHREATEELAAADLRMRLLEANEAEAVEQFVEGSLDAVWLDGDHSWQGMIAALERWWPKVREGGIMAGTGARDAFEGPASGHYTWSLAEAALKHWAAQQDVQVLMAGDEMKCWLVAKFTRPQPCEITVITGATQNLEYAEASVRNHRQYCERHGYRYRMFTDEGFARDRALCWSKIKFAREALQDSRWVFWIDADAIFNQMDWKLANFCWPQFLMIAGQWEDGRIVRPSLGTMLMQAGAMTESLLAQTWASPGKCYGDGHEEDAIERVLTTRPEYQSGVMLVPTHYLNSRPPHHEWHSNDPILHFLEVPGTRPQLLEDACTMATARARRVDAQEAGEGSRLIVPQAANSVPAHGFLSGVPQVDAFLMNGYTEVSGMSSRFAAAIVCRLLALQTESNIHGGIVEIGTFMGRFLIAMSKALREGEMAVGIDHFQWPSPSVRQRYEAYCDYHGLPPEQRVTLTCDTLTLQPKTILEASRGPARLIHIDGEHTPEHLENDFKLGVAVRSERGVLVLDDMLHPAYPLLGQAVHDCLKRHPELQVLAVIDREDIVGAAKFVIGRREDRAFYETGLRRAFPEYVWSMPAQFEDYQALVLTPEPRLAQVF